MAKKRKPGAPSSVAKKKGRPGFGDAAKGRQGNDKPRQSENVFETLWTRRKFDVLGKKQKGEGKRVGLSRSAAVDKRKNTLLHEYKQRGKTNTFLDHRFGEQDDSLGDEDRAILRFQKERMVQMQRKSKFALQDDDEEDVATEVLTHGGTALSTLDDFKEDLSIGDEDEDGALNEDMVKELHFGGGLVPKRGGSDADGEGEGKRRTKKEVMEEVIAKSKFFKAQKAKEKEEDHELKEKVDIDFAALVQSNGLSCLVRPKKNVLKSLLERDSISKIDTNFGAPKADDTTREAKEKPDDFDKLLKEMLFETRGHASDRLKTAEEIAKEERTRLEELEKKRKQRMLGGTGSDEEASEGDNDEEETQRQKKKNRRDVSGDDLGENFVVEDEYQERGWVDEVLARKGNEEEEEEEEEGEEEEEEGSGAESEELEGQEEGSDDEELEGSDEGSDEDSAASEEENWEQSEDEIVGNDSIPKLSAKDQILLDKLLEAKKGTNPLKDIRAALQKEQKVSEKAHNIAPVEAHAVGSLPYVIEAPSTLLEFRSLVDHRPIEDLEIAVQRIRKCNAISLAAENRRKMQVFYNVLLQYFATMAGEIPLCFQRINALVKPLIELSGETRNFAALCARVRIVRMQRQLSEKLRSGEDISCWPSNRTLLLLRLWSMIFPPSDFRHGVMTPAMLLLAEYLLRCPVKSGRDVAVGSFICSLLLSVMRPAHRLCPEALNFLYALLLSAFPKASRAKGVAEFTEHCPAYLVEYVLARPWLQISSSKATRVNLQPLDFMTFLTADASSPIFETDSFKAGILSSVVWTLNGFVAIYKDIMAFPEVFSPFASVLEALRGNSTLPEGLLTLITQVGSSIAEKVKENRVLRQPLRMRMSKPVPIKMFNPRFEENYAQGRDYDPDRERAETKKLKRQLKREAKGAARELRKDNYFLAEEKAQETAVLEQERDEKYRKAMSFLEQQESAFKSGQLGKGRKRKKR